MGLNLNRSLAGRCVTSRYWLFKSEPGTYSFDDLVQDEVAEWDGVRNFQARNMLRDDIKVGDRVLFYHSSSKPLAVVGAATVMAEGYPDHTAQDPSSAHPDPKSTPDNPIWYMVDIRATERFASPVTRDIMKVTEGLEGMMLLRRGTRLSIQPITEKEWRIVWNSGNPTPV